MADTNRSSYVLSQSSFDPISAIKAIVYDIQGISVGGGSFLKVDGTVPSIGEQTFSAGIKTDTIVTSTVDVLKIISNSDPNIYVEFDTSITDQNVITIPDNSGTMLIGALQAGTFTPDATKAIRIKLVDGNEYLLQVVT